MARPPGTDKRNAILAAAAEVVASLGRHRKGNVHVRQSMVHHGRVTRLWPHLGGGALARGDKVVATARCLESLSDLAKKYGDAVLPLALDVTKREQVKAVIPKAHAHFGRLDVVINNAGYALLGAVEEATEADVRAEFETNFFGALAVIQTVLPLLRQQGSGHILGVSSVAGVSARPVMSFYNAYRMGRDRARQPDPAFGRGAVSRRRSRPCPDDGLDQRRIVAETAQRRCRHHRPGGAVAPSQDTLSHRWRGQDLPVPAPHPLRSRLRHDHSAGNRPSTKVDE